MRLVLAQAVSVGSGQWAVGKVVNGNFVSRSIGKARVTFFLAEASPAEIHQKPRAIQERCTWSYVCVYLKLNWYVGAQV